ncbi:winged helix-turn-helix transcriptional regulator [Oricola sp.]|uniref:winged helix-turn-helix transcriptional regulator n=1 Tax=Oricola sp. TaxID=1979950 RepID=UPI003BAD2084
MKSYGQFCPVAKAAELFCERWTPLIIRDLAAGATRFSELRRGVPLMSQTMLSRRLKQLEAEGIVERRFDDGARAARYYLTEQGREFTPMIEMLGIWGQRWSRRELIDEEVDLGLLVWSIERSVRADALGPERAVVRIDFIDQPAGKRVFWFVNENGACEMCMHDPGYEIDLYLEFTLRDAIYVIRGDLPLDRAVADGRLDVTGDTPMRARLRDWLNLSPLSAIPSARA